MKSNQQLEEWISNIGKYQLSPLKGSGAVQSRTYTNEEADTEVKKILGDEVKQLYPLYKGCMPKEETSAREIFVKYLDGILKKSPAPLNVDSTINMEAYLGKEGLELYKKAIKEERNSIAFRNAVFLASLKFYPGKKAAPPQEVTIISGASSTGKTYSAEKLLTKLAEQDPGEGSYVVSVDGGIEREYSQMRQLVLQSALSTPHCIGIKDLHKHTKLGSKQYVEKAAKTIGLHMVIPLTFSNPGDTKKMIQYMRKKDVEVIFSEVEADKIQTNLMGKSRAFLIGENKYSKDKNNIKLNNRDIGCESKVYEPQHFSTGVAGSNLAKFIFMLYERGESVWTIKNDLIFVKKAKDGKKWVKCNGTDVVSPDLRKMTARDFEKWKEGGFDPKFNLKSPPEITKTRDLLKLSEKLPILLKNALEDEIKSVLLKTKLGRSKSSKSSKDLIKALEEKMLSQSDVKIKIKQPTPYSVHRMSDTQRKKLAEICHLNKWEMRPEKGDILAVYRNNAPDEKQKPIAQLDHTGISMKYHKGQTYQELADIAVKLAATYEPNKEFLLEPNDMLPAMRKVFEEAFKDAGFIITSNSPKKENSHEIKNENIKKREEIAPVLENKLEDKKESKLPKKTPPLLTSTKKNAGKFLGDIKNKVEEYNQRIRKTVMPEKQKLDEESVSFWKKTENKKWAKKLSQNIKIVVKTEASIVGILNQHGILKDEAARKEMVRNALISISQDKTGRGLFGILEGIKQLTKNEDIRSELNKSFENVSSQVLSKKTQKILPQLSHKKSDEASKESRELKNVGDKKELKN